MPAASSGGRMPLSIEHQRLDQIVEVALVVRDVHDAAAPNALAGMFDVLGDALDLAENRIERMLQRAVEPVSLRGASIPRDSFRCGLLASAAERVRVVARGTSRRLRAPGRPV